LGGGGGEVNRFAILGDKNVIKKEAKKIIKYKDLTTETEQKWKVKTKMVTEIIGATGNIF